MFSFRSKEEPPLQLYGKLPLAKDYLRVGCGSAAGRTLREWMDRGFAGAFGEGGTVPVLPHGMRFLWRDPTGEHLQGTLRPSTDAGGLRAFPLALFVERRSRALLAELARAGAGDEGWWRALDQCHAEIAGFAEGGDLLTTLRGRKVTRSEVADERGSQGVDFETWTETLWPGEGRSGCERVLRELDALSRDASREGRNRILRLPVAWGPCVTLQVGAWIRVLEELEWTKKATASTLFYPAVESSTQAPAFLLVVPATPEPQDTSWLLSVPPTPVDAGDLCTRTPAQALPSETAASTSSPPLESALCDVLAAVRGRVLR